MGKSMNLNNLTPEEAQQILQVIQKDFELRQKERERLSKIEEDISEEDNKTALLTKQQKFNENCCIRCCQTFGVIFNRKQTCQACKLFVCKSCAEYDDNIKGYICKACFKEVELKQKSFNWFYDNVGRRFKRFGSAKVVRTLYKHSDGSRSKFHYSSEDKPILEQPEGLETDLDCPEADNESDSGYDPSLYSSFGQSGSIRGAKNRPSLKGVFPEIVISDADDQELDNGLFPPPPLNLSPNGNSYQESPNTSLEEIQSPQGRSPPVPSPRTSVTTPTQTTNDLETDNEKKDIYKEAFENTRRTEEAKFKVRFDNLLTEMQSSFEDLSPRDGSIPDNFGIHAYGEKMSNYRSRVKDMLVSLSQRLELAVESFDETCANSPALTSQKVRQIISKLVEDRLGESLDLTSDEAVSDLSSLSDDSTDQKSFEDQIAQAVIARVLEQHRQLSGVHLTLDEPRSQRESESSTSEDKPVFTENTVSNSRDPSVNEDKLRNSSISEDKKMTQNRNSSVSEERLKDSPVNEDKKIKQSHNSSVNEERKGRRRAKSEEVRLENNNNVSDESDKNVFTGGEEEEGEDEMDGENVQIPNGSSRLGVNSNKIRSKSESDTSSNDSGIKTQKDVIEVDEKRLLQEEFNKLRNFAQEVVPKPLYEEVTFVEDVEDEPIVENMERVEIDHDESQEEFQTRFFTYDKVHDNENNYHLPDFSDLDYEYHDFGVNEIDPDLLSMNLAPIMEETEEELEEDKEENGEDEETDWRGNWMFKGASGVNPYSSFNKSKVVPDFGDGSFMVPTPAGDITPRVGNQGVDDMSDMSENDDRDSLDGLSDEENSFYAKTSEEIARITRKSSSSTQNALGNTPVNTEGESDAESVLSRQHSSSFSDSGIRGSRGLDQNSFDSRVSDNKPPVKLSEDLIPAENDDPKFEIPPDSLTIPEGEPAKLTCRVAGTQPLDVFWYRVREDIEELENSENYEITKDGSRNHLTMYNMTKQEAGQYMCMAINENGRCCQYFILHVKKNTQELKKPEFLKTPTDLEVTEGQSVKFRCKVKGYPQPRVIWYKDGQILLNRLNYRLERFGNRDYLLSIDSASMDEDAEYSVLAKNIAGETRASAQLIVEPKNKPESVPKTAKSREARTVETPKEDNKKSSSSDLYDTAYLPWIKKSSKQASSLETQKDNNNLSNIGQKLSMTKDSVTDVAEDMLSSTKELTEINKSIAAMDKMLEELESDMYSAGSDMSSELDTSATLISTLPQHSSIIMFNNYMEVQEAAKNIRKVTSSTLDYINTTDSFVRREKNMGAIATSTPRNSDSERIFNLDSDTSQVACDSDIGMDNVHDTSEDSHKSEVSFNVITPKSRSVTSQNETPVNKESGSLLKDALKSNFSVRDVPESQKVTVDRDTSENNQSEKLRLNLTSLDNSESKSDEPIRVNLGPKRENKEWYQKDFYITNTPLMKRKSPDSSPRDATPQQSKDLSSSNKVSKTSTQIDIAQRAPSPIEEKQRARTEEKIYLTANNVYNLENRVQTLQDKMRAVNTLSEQDKMSKLENQVAKTVAQVASSEKQVKDVEKSVTKLVEPQTDTKKPVSTKSKPAPTVPVIQAPPTPKPEPTFLKGDTKEQDIPESRTEFNEEYGSGFELPSVSRLKAMFGQNNSSQDSSFKRVHSITARSVPKGQLEKLRETASDDPRSRVQVVSSNQPTTPGRATALTTGQQIRTNPSSAKQVFQSSTLNSDSSRNKSVHIPKQSIQVSSSTKSSTNGGTKAQKSMKLTLSTSGTSRPLSPDQSKSSSQSSQPISNTVTKVSSTVPSSSQSQDLLESGAKSGVDIDTSDERKSPKIKSGAISAMSKFWEKVNEGAKGKAPEILEYD